MNTASHRLASREHTSHGDTVVEVRGAHFGGDSVCVIAGPCAIESRERTFADARRLRSMGVRVMRGGAYKPRTSPYSFQGLGMDGLRILHEVRTRYDMVVATEVLAVEDVAAVAAHADILQIGARNMQNFRLLQAVGESGRPVLLKRGLAATIEELLCAAEYVLAAGNPNVILCERGVRGFEPGLRGTLDLGAVALLRQLTHLPVIVDPSHATGVAELVAPVSVGAVAAGANGLIVEATLEPQTAVVDGDQTIDLSQLEALLGQIDAVARATGRRVDLRPVATAAPRVHVRPHVREPAAAGTSTRQHAGASPAA
jgi:3-deoxy-7-phosphoheptulonate synthase